MAAYRVGRRIPWIVLGVLLSLAGCSSDPAGPGDDHQNNPPNGGGDGPPDGPPGGPPQGEVFVYVSNYGSAEVTVIRASDQTVVKTTDVGRRPLGFAVSPDGRTLYVSHNAIAPATDTVTLTAIRTSDHEITRILPRSASQAANVVAITPDGDYLYLTNYSFNPGDPTTHLQVIRTSDFGVAATIPAGPHRDVVISPDGAFAYITGCNPCGAGGNGFLTVVRTSDNAIVTTVPLDAEANRVAMTPDGSRLYVTHTLSDGVKVIRTSDNTVVDEFDVEASLGIGVSPDGDFVWITDRRVGEEGSVTVVRTSDHQVHTEIPVGREPQGIGFTPDGALAYVTNYADGTVTVIDAASFTVLTTVDVGTQPLLVASVFVEDDAGP